jgi:DNA-binding transcriptional ArsR family regulator
VPVDADLAAIGRVFGDSHRAQFLLALLSGEELAAGELAARSHASSSLASAHLSKLLAAGMVSVRREGRQRYYRIADAEVARAIEGVLAIAPARPPRSLRESRRASAIRQARTCYDHLAGHLGVALADALERTEALVVHDGGWELTPAGANRLEAFGLDIDALRRLRRPLLRPCLDWTERRPHVAGALGAAVSTRMFEQDWLRRVPGTRAVSVTSIGGRRLRAAFDVELG